MPRIPTYQPNQVRPVEAVDTRFRAANDGGGAFGALGEGLQKLGIAVDKYATVEDGIQDKFDDTYSRSMALEFEAAKAGVLTQYGSTQGKGAIDLAGATQEQLKKLRDDTLAKASNPRMKRYLEERLAEPFTKAMSTVTGHSLQQQVVMAKGTALSERGMAIDEAAGSFADPKLAAAAKSKALTANAELARIEGWSPEQTKAENLSLTTKIHQGAVDVMLSQTDPDLDLVSAYAAAHKGEMTTAAYSGILKDLQKPFQEREADTLFREVISETVVTPTEPGKVYAGSGNPYTVVAKDVAKKFGLDPIDVAAVMSYETGGTFNPALMGGKNNQYMGLIQFGPAERKKYGITEKSTPEQWSKAVIGFLSDRGYKKGMGTLDLYSTINAGTPGRYNASDGNGTVRSHHDKIMAQHRGKAAQWVGGSADPEAPRSWDKDATYNAIDAKAKAQGWSFELTERVKRRADQKITMDESLLKRQESAADETAEEIVTTKGDGFTSINMIPSEIRANMTPTVVAKYTALAEENRKPKEVKPNGPDAITLKAMMDSDDPAFASIKLSDYVGKVSKAEFEAFAVGQAKAKRNPPDAWSPYSGVNTALTTVKRLNPGAKLDDDDLARITIDMAAAAKEAKAAGKPIDYDALARQYTRKVVINKTGMFGGVTPSSVPIYDVGMENIPEAKRTEISQFLQSRLRRKPTDDEIIATFRQTYNFQNAP